VNGWYLAATKIIAPPTNQALVSGEPSVVSCLTTSDPTTPVTHVWYINGNPVSIQPGLVDILTNGSLFVNTPQLANEIHLYVGNYTCVVNNGYSEAQSSAIIAAPR
jgi:hypothetical protein